MTQELHKTILGNIAAPPPKTMKGAKKFFPKFGHIQLDHDSKQLLKFAF